jgi:hypothetical protein
MAMPERNYQTNKYRYGFNGQEHSDDVTEGNYTAEFWEYDSRIGRRWNVDPVLKIWESPYLCLNGNPIRISDIKGDDGEYDKDGKKISDLGGDKVNFYHQANGDTKVENQENCATTVIKGGEKIIKDFTQRQTNISWWQIYREWETGTGPVKSIVADFDNTTKGAFGSLNSTFSSYASLAREASLKSNALKGMVTMDYGSANPIVAQDMWEQMWGRSNISWYKIGDKTLFLMTDSKSMTSFAFRLSPSWERSKNYKFNGNTYQTYIWTETNIEVKNKVEEKKEHFHQEFLKILQECKRPLPGKI